MWCLKCFLPTSAHLLDEQINILRQTQTHHVLFVWVDTYFSFFLYKQRMQVFLSRVFKYFVKDRKGSNLHVPNTLALQLYGLTGLD